MIFIPIIIVLILIIGYFIYNHYKVRIKRAKYLKLARQSKQNWQAILQTHFDNFELLNRIDQDQLHKEMSIFFHEKLWSSEFSEKDKVIESAKACLPIINRKSNYYPLIKEITSKRSLKEWLQLNEPQFAIEFGKTNLMLFNGEFANESEIYFKNPEAFKERSPKNFELLNRFYKLNT